MPNENQFNLYTKIMINFWITSIINYIKVTQVNREYGGNIIINPYTINAPLAIAK